MMSPCFIHGYEKLSFIAMKHCQALNWNILTTLILFNTTPTLHTAVLCPIFQSICNVQLFFKCLPCLLACEFSVNGYSNPFCGFSSVVTSFRWPLQYLSWLLIQPCLNSVTQYFIDVDGADSPRVESSLTLILAGPFKWKYCIT